MFILPIPATLGALDRGVPPEIDDRAAIRNRLEAEERVLADVDSFANWLSTHCANEKPVELGYIPRNPVRRQQFIESLTVAQLAAGLLHVTIAFDCANRLREVYLADPHTAAYLERIVEKLECAA